MAYLRPYLWKFSTKAVEKEVVDKETQGNQPEVIFASGLSFLCEGSLWT